MQKTLNPKLWDKYELKSDVLEGIRNIYEFFMNDFIDKSIPLDPTDVRIVGSNAAYNYTDKSDLDIHIIDGNRNKEDITRYAQWKATRDFNNKYEITIKGVPVELYIEDEDKPAVSNGVFSVTENRWIKYPLRRTPHNASELSTIDDSKEWVQVITQAEENATAKEIKALIDRMYAMRKDSIADSGEYGRGNLIFKYLRDNGYVDRIKNALDKAVSKELSVESLNESLLTERTRGDLLRQSKDSVKGRQRYNRRIKSSVARTVQQYNEIDMNKLFKEDILTVDLPVRGETDNYIVKISFGGFLDALHDEMHKNGGVFDFRAVTRALVSCFDRDDVFVHCSCPDAKYRMDYWQTKRDYNSGAPQMIPANITNPMDSLGSSCKHVLLVLSNHSWLLKVASVIKNYVAYMEKHYQKMYADIIYPAIYEKPYEYGVQISIDDEENVPQSDTISRANIAAKKGSQFQKGNVQGVRFAPKSKPDEQVQIEDEEVVEEN